MPNDSIRSQTLLPLVPKLWFGNQVVNQVIKLMFASSFAERGCRLFWDVSPTVHNRHGELMATRNARIGLVLFAVYLLLYGGFVLLNAFAPQMMEATPIAGINLAILYGFGLIIAALVMALFYGWLCTPEGDVSTNGESALRRPEGER